MKLLAALRQWLAPAICDRCGQVWTVRTGSAGAAACPCCGYEGTAPRR